MEMRKSSGLLACAGILALTLLSGCGGSSSSNSIPATATIFYAHSLVFRNNSAMTMGYNGFGQLGDATLTTRAVAAIVPGLGHMDGGATGGEHTLVFNNTTSVKAWGYNLYGQLGNASVSTSGTSAFSSTPVSVTGFHGAKVTAVAAGGFHSLAVAGGAVYGWGYNAYGQVGNGTFVNTNTPVQVLLTADGTPLIRVAKVAAGGNHSLALTDDGRVYAWGNNGSGQLGANTSNPVTGLYNGAPRLVEVPQVPVDPSLPDNFGLAMVPLSQVIQIVAGGSTSYALQSDGTVWAWGYNGLGQLGIDPALATFRSIPVKITFDPTVIGTHKVVQISAGTSHVLARLDDSDGTVLAWGLNNQGQAGNNDISAPPNASDDHTRILSPVKVLTGGSISVGSGIPMTGVTDIIAFGNHSLAKIGNNWFGWGDNGLGQLGNPISNSSIGYLLLPLAMQGYLP